MTDVDNITVTATYTVPGRTAINSYTSKGRYVDGEVVLESVKVHDIDDTFFDWQVVYDEEHN